MPADPDDEPDPHDIARRIVLQRLAERPRSRAELETVLRRRGCPEEVAATVLDRMVQVGLVDDEAYAALVVRSRHETRGWARSAVARDLRQRGVAAGVVEAAVASLSTADEVRRAEDLVRRRLPRLAAVPPQVQTRRLAAMLARRGYSAEVVFAALRSAGPGSSPEGDPEAERLDEPDPPVRIGRGSVRADRPSPVS